jgi:predicted dehydrogenase
MHADAASESLAAGKPLFLEKPLALSIEEGRRVLAAWRRSGVAAGIGYNFRRNPNVAAARAVLHSGSLGELVAIQSTFHWAADRIEGWRAVPGQGGGALLDLASHHVDLVAFLAGRHITRVQGAVRSCRTPDDTAALTLLLDHGVAAQIHATSAAGAPINRIGITGSRGSLSVDLLAGRPSEVERRPGRGARLHRAWRALGELHPARILRSPGFEPSFGLTVEAFLEAVRTGVAPTPDLGDGFRALAVVTAGLASARSNGEWRPVEAAE